MKGLHLGAVPWVPLDELSAAELAAVAARAEDLGLSSLWLPESHFSGSHHGFALPDPLTMLAAAAAGSARLRLGTASYLLPIRSPLQAAEQVAVLDRLCSGRLILGLGRGFASDALRAFGVDEREKRTLFERNLEIMKRAWRGEPLQALADGESPGGARPGESGHSELRLSPLPWQRPHPPLWMAAFGDKALCQAGRLGMPYLGAPTVGRTKLAHNLEVLRAAARAADVALSPLLPLMRVVFVSHSAALCERVKAALNEGARALSARRGRALGQIGDADSWALVGEPAEVVEGIREYQETLGMTHLIVTRFPGGDRNMPGTGEREESMRLLAAALR